MPKKIAIKKRGGKPTPVNFQDTILNLQKFWGNYGCVILQPYDIEVGAGTFHPATTLRSLGPKPWKAAMFSPLEDQRTEDTEKILIVYNTIINSKL